MRHTVGSYANSLRQAALHVPTLQWPSSGSRCPAPTTHLHPVSTSMPLSSGVPSSTIRTGLVLAGMLRLTGLGFQAACTERQIIAWGDSRQPWMSQSITGSCVIGHSMHRRDATQSGCIAVGGHSRKHSKHHAKHGAAGKARHSRQSAAQQAKHGTAGTCVDEVMVMYSRGARLASPANVASRTSLSICGVGGTAMRCQYTVRAQLWCRQQCGALQTACTSRWPVAGM